MGRYRNVQIAYIMYLVFLGPQHMRKFITESVIDYFTKAALDRSIFSGTLSGSVIMVCGLSLLLTSVQS